MKKILLAEDDFDFGSILKQYLELHQFDVTWTKNGEDALNYLTGQEVDICVFDVMMPKMDGFSLAEKVIEQKPETPFIFLTAKKMKEDKIKGLKLGADDYIVKPFEADELVLRINNIIKRGQRFAGAGSTVQIGAYTFNPANHTLKHQDELQRLTEKEAHLIQYLFERKDQLVKRDHILRDVWGNDDFFSGRSMDVFISRLRKYFKNDPDISIKSVRGIGLEFKIEKQS
ncbi:response regulator [Leptobacterium flavescens]|uniref:Response regulator n=1 Tax=Leptobacterium flavescens TaxID=472055 RepID=A0A6P0UNQ0_9FLAO|nr:response regulator transcription factor [Leptobacterium flavescens]NER14934.1 response regulator [Leptobacterium flavescens]